ncbi:hypothetical protein EBZ02_08225 [bacterium]|nr:hypothetical protein [bacterium]
MIVTLAGTVAAAVLELTRLTVRSLVKLKGIPTVPVEALAPTFSATDVGFSTKVSAGWVTVPLTVKLLLALPLTLLTLPFTAPAEAAAEIRTYTVLDKVPSPAGAKEKELVKPVEELVLTSIAFVEAVTTRFETRLVPVTV